MTSVTSTPRRVVVSDAVIHPGELLGEELEVRGMTQRELALAMGRPPQLISEIVRGRRGISRRDCSAARELHLARPPTSGWGSTPTTASHLRSTNRVTTPQRVSVPKIVPDIAIPPGELLAEELEARSMTQRDLATRMGRPPRVISEIVRGRKAIHRVRPSRSSRRSARLRPCGLASRRSTASPSPARKSRSCLAASRLRSSLASHLNSPGSVARGVIVEEVTDYHG